MRVRTPAAAGAAAVLCGSCAAGQTQGPPGGGTSQGRDIAHLFDLYLYGALAVFVIVAGLITWSVLRYRRKGDDDGSLPRQTRFNIPLEATYTIIPLVMVISLFAVTIAVQRRVDRTTAHPQLTVQVEGFQWGWRFTYPDRGVTVAGTDDPMPELAVPLGVRTRFEITAVDVIHSFYVPGFLFKRDAIPGQLNKIDMTPTHLGTYVGHCAEFCGVYHARMGFTVRVLDPSGFDRWLSDHRTTPTGG